MRRILYLIIIYACTSVSAVSAQDAEPTREGEPMVSRQFRNKSMSDVLISLRRATDRYRISFIYNELEDFRVSKSFEGLTIPEAIRECIGFYPISMVRRGDSLLVVECTEARAFRQYHAPLSTQLSPLRSAWREQRGWAILHSVARRACSRGRYMCGLRHPTLYMSGGRHRNGGAATFYRTPRRSDRTGRQPSV